MKRCWVFKQMKVKTGMVKHNVKIAKCGGQTKRKSVVNIVFNTGINYFSDISQ